MHKKNGRVNHDRFFILHCCVGVLHFATSNLSMAFKFHLTESEYKPCAYRTAVVSIRTIRDIIWVCSIVIPFVPVEDVIYIDMYRHFPIKEISANTAIDRIVGMAFFKKRHSWRTIITGSMNF